MKVHFHLTGNLRAILSHLPAEITVVTDRPTSLPDLLIRAGINPLLVVVPAVDGVTIPRDSVIDRETTVVLFGPLAGG